MNPLFGKAFPCQCRRQSFEERRRAALMKYCDFPDDEKPRTFASYVLDTERGNEGALSAVIELVAGSAHFVTLAGPSNTGKTHLALAACHDYIDAGIPAKFYSCDLFLNDLKATFDRDANYKYQDVFNKACAVPLLVLDDFYQGKRTEWMESQLESIVNARYLKKMATIFTTNVPLSEMSERIASRLQRESWCRVVVL